MKKIYILLLFSFLYTTSSFANRNIEWNLAMQWKTTYTPVASASFKMAQLVKEMSNERFIIRINGQERHNSKDTILDLVKSNQYQMGHTTTTLYKDLDINTIWFTTTAFGMTAKEQNTWFYQGNGQKYMEKVFDKYGVLAFPAGNLEEIGAGWFNKEIKSIDDLKGLKVLSNTPGLANEILLMHGVVLKDIPQNEIQDAFVNREINVMNGASGRIDMKMEYYKIAPYYYKSWNQPSWGTQFLVNKEAYEKLPKNYQIILKTAMQIASDELYYENIYTSANSWKKMLKDYPNIQIKTLPKDVLTTLEKTKKIIFTQYGKQDKLFKEIYQDQENFLKIMR